MAYSKKLEMATLDKMLGIYCHDTHKNRDQDLCEDCRALREYARLRLEKCPYGDNKPVCSECPIHCYRPVVREEIREVMKYAGPRMLKKHPVLAVRYMYRKKFKSHPDRLHK